MRVRKGLKFKNEIFDECEKLWVEFAKIVRQIRSQLPNATPPVDTNLERVIRFS